MDRLVVSQDDTDPTGVPSYGMVGYDMERRGRTRSLVDTGFAAAVLFPLQVLPWCVSTGRLPSQVALSPLISARLSLLFDFLFLGAMSFHGLRAWELVRMDERQESDPAPLREADSQRASSRGRDSSSSFRRWARDAVETLRNFRRWVGRGASGRVQFTTVCLAILMGGVFLDAFENVWLWAFTDPERSARLFVPVLTPTVWVLLVLGALGLWWMASLVIRGDLPTPDGGFGRPAGGAQVGVDGVSNRTKDAAAAPPLRGTVITCSGGGIRSTAFCLGGLQVLAKRSDPSAPGKPLAIYQQARCVVGVSGGGYIAAAMHIVRGRARFRRLEPPAFADSSPEEAWLRRNTRYLLESARVAALGGMSLLYGILVNLFLVAGVLVFAAWWLGWFYSASGGLTNWNTAEASAAQYDHAWSWVTWTALLPLAAMAIFIAADAADRLFELPASLRTGARWVCVFLLVLGLGALLGLFVAPWLMVTAHNFAANSGSPLARLITAAGLIPPDLCETLVKTGDACGSTGGAPSVAGASLITFATVLAAIIAVLRQARRFLPDVAGSKADAGALYKLVDRVLLRLLPWAALFVIVVAALTLLLRWISALVANPTLLGHWGWFYLVGVVFVVLRLSTDANRTSLHYFYRERLSHAFVLERAASGVRPVPYTEQLRFSEFRPHPSPLDTPVDGWEGGPELIACASANVRDNEVVPADRYCVPFNFSHQTIGLAGDLFPGEARTPSRLFEFHADHAFRVATIPAAMAISGAAFSPLAGRFTRRMAPYRVVMALANARLGVWLPNPLWIEDARVFNRLVKLRLADEVESYLHDPTTKLGNLRLQRLSADDLLWLRGRRLPPEARAAIQEVPMGNGRRARVTSPPFRPKARYVWHRRARAVIYRPGAFRLAKEAFGKTSIYDRFLYVTDGGHYDNLGLVEALRHRPQAVYVLDASSDPEDSFSTLGQAIATARMDLGCEVELDLTGLHRSAKNKPPHFSFDSGTVRYPDGAVAQVHYVKAIVTRKLPWDVDAYAKEHATFPRTSTTNQLYGEFDLEAYRVLGREGTTALLDAIASMAQTREDEPQAPNVGQAGPPDLPHGSRSADDLSALPLRGALSGALRYVRDLVGTAVRS